jgi:uncharacterized protein YaaW (UPF0174 family)
MDKSTKDLLALLKKCPADRLAPIYARHGIEPSAGPSGLVEELRLDGSNTIASVFRGWEGVDYAEMVNDVAEKFDVKTENLPVETIEREILVTMIRKHYSNASPKEREKLEKILREMGDEYDDLIKILLKGTLSGAALALLIEQIGVRLVAAAVERIVLQIIGRNAAAGAAEYAAALAGFAIPFLNVVLAAWVIIDIAGPAFRKTVPTVIEIALLRMEYGVLRKGQEGKGEAS